MPKFKRGDFVYIGEMPECMRHFDKRFVAIVQYTYAEEYGGANIKDYCVMHPDTGSATSWYDESQLEYIGNTGTELSYWLKFNKDKLAAADNLVPIPIGWQSYNPKPDN